MGEHRIIIYGNSGAGKTTIARELANRHGLEILLLDDIAWSDWEVRKPIEESAAEIDEFVSANDQWVMEGCYGDLVQVALPRCTELRFLNPSIETCVANCRRRPWEPDKYESPQAQQESLDMLIMWIREYESRDDECGLRFHREIFDGFDGAKQELR